MSMYPSTLRTELPEPRLRWMMLASLLIHLIILLVFFGKPPDTSKKIYFSPVYSVSLVDMPPGPPGPKSGSQPTRLWKGPAALQSETKTPSMRSHNIITVEKSEEYEYSPESKKRASDKEGPQKPSGASGQEGKTSAADQPPAEGGGGGGGGGGGTTDLRFSLYYQAIWTKIQQAWILPPYDKKGQLEAIVVISISRDGKILNMDFEKRSGDENLDNSVVRAIRKADPLPPLPNDFKENVLEVGIRFIPDEKKF